MINAPDQLHAKQNLMLLLIATALGVLFNALFQHIWQLRLNYTLLILSVFTVTYFVLRQNPAFCRRFYLAGSFIALLFAAYFSVYTNPFFQMVNFILIPILYGCSILFAYQNRPEGLALLRLLFAPFPRIHHYFLSGIKTLSPSKELSTTRRSVLLGILISALLLLIIVPLMISSDQMIAALLKNGFKNLSVNLQTILSYLFWFALVASYAYASLRHSLLRTFQREFAEKAENTPANALMPGRKTAVLTVLSVLTAVYVLFFALQLIYTAGHLRVGLPANFDYAGYARSGFFQLLALSLINILILFVTFSMLKAEQNLRMIKLLLVLFTAVTLALAASSLFRMYLYEGTYGYTILRLIVFLFLYFEIATLLLTFVYIYRRRLPIVKIVLVAAMLYYIVILFFNTEGYVAKKNIDRYKTTGKIDTAYLASLSADAALQIVRLQDDDNNDIVYLLQQKQQNAQSSLAKKKDIRNYNYAEHKADALYGALQLKKQVFMVYLQNNTDSDILSFAIRSEKPSATSIHPIPADATGAYLVEYAPSASYVIDLHFTDGQTYTQPFTLSPALDKTTYLSVVNKNNSWYVYGN